MDAPFVLAVLLYYMSGMELFQEIFGSILLLEEKKEEEKNMLKVKMFQNPDVEKLTKLVEESNGKVLLRSSDESLHNLKTDSSAFHLIKQETERNHEVEFQLSDTGDYLKFIYFVMGDCA